MIESRVVRFLVPTIVLCHLAISFLNTQQMCSATGRCFAVTTYSDAIGQGSEGQGAAIVNGYKSMGANSGDIFLGKPYRTYDDERKFLAYNKEDKKTRSFNAQALFQKLSAHHRNTTTCTKWSVVTTIFEPSDAIVSAGQLGTDWCLIIVGDNKTPPNYLGRAKDGSLKKDNIFFLSMDDQKIWEKLKGTTNLGKMIALKPENHFGRKNLGFLYAILRGATFIFDFDDDNYVDKDNAGNLRNILPDESEVGGVRMVATTTTVFNHHPLMKTSIEESWARGFPLGSILDKNTRGTVSSVQNLPMENVAVIQFCANDNPDVDAIHRFVKPLPMFFSQDVSPVLVPSNAFSPYNAQATIHTQPALFATLLPVTVKGRVSDIWRSYFSQAIFKRLEMGVIFAPPKITQIRNAHNYYGDMESERDLYFKGERLIEFLSSWTSDAPSTVEQIEELWIALYERGYIEKRDVQILQYWLGVLEESDYTFGTKASSAIPSVSVPQSAVRVLSATQEENEVSAQDEDDEKDAPSYNDDKKYLCMAGVFADNCNKILSLARGKRWALEKGLEFAVMTDPENYDPDWFYSWFDPSPHFTLPKPGQMLNCVLNITGKDAYYNKFANQRESNPYIKELPKYLLPRKDIRERAEKAFKDKYGDKRVLSVHRRNHARCWWRATDGKFGRNVGGGKGCSKDVMLEMCTLDYSIVQQKFNPHNLTVVLFSDGRNATLDSTFPIMDDEDFETQIWMMTQSEEHVGIPVSTVDLVVNHWRYAQGRSTVYPAGCYNEYLPEYQHDPSHFE